MSERPIQKIDLVPDWLRHVVAEQEEVSYKEPPRKKDFTLIMPTATKNAQGAFPTHKLVVKIDPIPSWAAVSLKWEGNVSEWEKKTSPREAEMLFNTAMEGCQRASSLVEVDPERAQEELVTTLKLLGPSDALAHGGSSSGAGSEKSLLKIAEGWNVIEKEGKMSVDFSDDFLTNVLKDYKVQDSEPVQPGEIVYSTASRPHCGSDDFVVSYWRKVKTADGNIVRNASLVSRMGGKSFFVSGISVDGYNELCSALTPSHKHYGISYDSVTGRWIKTAGEKDVVIERVFFKTVDDAIKWKQEAEGKKKGEESPEPIEDKGKEEKDGEAAEGTESLPIGAEESLPVSESPAEAAATGGSPEEQLMDLLKK